MAASRRDRIRYRSDRIMSAGAKAQLAALALLSMLVIAVVFAIIVVTDVSTGGLPRLTVLYHELLEVMDPGTVANFGGGSWAFSLLSVGVTIYGIFVVGSLIGILSNALDQRIQNLRKGRSRVVEDGHIVVLGWADQIFSLLQEIVLANESRGRTAVAIMAPQDKVEMEDAIKAKLHHHESTRMVCRTGNPLDMVDLRLLSLDTCQAVIILTPDGEPDPDALLVKSLMALMAAGTGEETFPVFAEIHDPANAGVAELAGRGRVQLIPGSEFTARIVAESASQPGLSAVFVELLDYEGDELYLTELPELVGSAFGDCLLRFEDSTPIGIATAGGDITINPPMDTVLAAGDRLIAISEDDDTVLLNARAEIDPAAIQMGDIPPEAPTRTLVLGENAQLPVITQELERRAAPGSSLVVASPSDGSFVRKLSESCERQHVSHKTATPTRRRHLEALDPASFDRVVLLTDPDLPPEEADARTLTSLLHVRDLHQRAGKAIPVVSEMQVPQNKNLAEASTDYDFVVSAQLISLYLSQVVMTPALGEVFRELLTGPRSLIEINPVGGYVRTDSPVNFATVTEAARQRGHVAIGYRTRRGDARATLKTQVTVNPDKSVAVTFEPTDQIIVLAAP